MEEACTLHHNVSTGAQKGQSGAGEAISVKLDAVCKLTNICHLTLHTAPLNKHL